VDKHVPSLTLNDVQFLAGAAVVVVGAAVVVVVVGAAVVVVVVGAAVVVVGATYRLIELLELTGEDVPAELVAVTVV
jgi:hypothetical protein